MGAIYYHIQQRVFILFSSSATSGCSFFFFFFSSRRRHTRFDCDWSSDVCSSDLDPRRRSFYGHAVVPSWYAEASTVLDLDGQPCPVTDQHQILEYAVGADGLDRKSVV